MVISVNGYRVAEVAKSWRLPAGEPDNPDERYRFAAAGAVPGAAATVPLAVLQMAVFG
jgi:hypothetical protein